MHHAHGQAEENWTKPSVRVMRLCSCAIEYRMSTSGTCEKCPKNAATSWLQLVAIIVLVLALLAMVLYFFARQMKCVPLIDSRSRE